MSLWDQLVQATEQLGGGLSSHSSPSTKDTVRKVFRDLLTKFPLLYGYWKRYTEAEYLFSGVEGAIEVYEQSVSAFPISVDIWTQYITFAIQYNGDNISKIRLLCERGASLCGRDFLSHPFWDKYLEFEESLSPNSEEVLKILLKLIKIPLHQYARYFEKFLSISQIHSNEKIIDDEITLKSILEGLGNENPTEEEIRKEITNYNLKIFAATQQGTNSRWKFESKITRPYYHSAPLEPSELENWNDYLNYEESVGSFESIRFLYERALVPCANYESIWLRYIRWMMIKEKSEEVMNIYHRAVTIYIPKARCFIRHQYALYCESLGKLQYAKDVYDSLLKNGIEPITSWKHRIQFERRYHGSETAIQFCNSLIKQHSSKGTKDFKLPSENENDKDNKDSNSNDDSNGYLVNYVTDQIAGVLSAEAAKIYWKNENNIILARDIFQKYCRRDFNVTSTYFWTSYFQFEKENSIYSRNVNNNTNETQLELLRALVKRILEHTSIPQRTIKDIVNTYLQLVISIGSKSDSLEYSELDAEINGPLSVQKNFKRKLVSDGLESTANKKLKNENGKFGGEIEYHYLKELI